MVAQLPGGANGLKHRDPNAVAVPEAVAALSSSPSQNTPQGNLLGA